MSSDPSAPPPGGPQEGAAPSRPTPPAPVSDSRRPRRGPPISPRLTAALAVAVVAAVVIFLVTRSGGSNSSTSTSPTTAPAAPAVTRSPPAVATVTDLRTLQTQVGHPVYWAGPANGRVLTSQRASDRSVYVRYLTPGTALTSPAQRWLTVVSYLEANAYGLAQAGAKRPGASSHHLAGGVLTVTPPNRPTNVFLSRPGSTVLVEVFDPTPGTALRDVLSGRIRPVG